MAAFLLVFLILLLVLFFTVFRLGNRFGAKDRYWIETAEADVHELHPGTEVLILGKPVGEVLDLNYLEDGRGVRVDLQLTRQKTPQIFQDSIVRLERKFGVGTPVLVIRRIRVENAVRRRSHLIKRLSISLLISIVSISSRSRLGR